MDKYILIDFLNNIEWIGLLFAFFIGIFIGMIGGGGSILTVPVLVYLLHINTVLSTAYSLFIVGVTSLLAMLNYLLKGLVEMKTAIIFVIPSFIGVYVTRLYIVPMIPQQINFYAFVLQKHNFIMLFFAFLILLASISMIRTPALRLDSVESKPRKFPYFMIFVEGILVGMLTGIVGAGGGFLIIPVLVLFSNLPMRMAVGTSLFIISIKSLIGFIGDIQVGQPIEWSFLLTFTFITVLGSFFGVFLSRFISEEKLKKIFGYFILFIVIFISFKEIWV